MELVLVEHNAGVELDATEYAEVIGAELVGSTELGSGRGRQMERGHDGRRESRRWANGAGGPGTGEQRRQSLFRKLGWHGRAGVKWMDGRDVSLSMQLTHIQVRSLVAAVQIV
jgi:hypothetical protein